MRKIAVFLTVLILLFSINAFAEEDGVSSVPEETNVEILLRNRVSLTEQGATLLIGGNASALWQDFCFDMYPYTAEVLTVEDTLSADWLSGIRYLSVYSPTAVVFCLDGNDEPQDVSALAEALAGTLSSARIYFVSAFTGKNTARVNESAAETLSSYPNAGFVDVYTLMLTEDGVPDTQYIGESVTSAGLRLMGKTVYQALNTDIPVIAPSVSVPEEESYEETEQTSGRSYRWLIPVAILAVGLIIGVDRACRRG